MRMIGSLPDEPTARRFRDHLIAQGIANDVESGSDGWAIWVQNEDHLETAEKELKEFQANPDDPRYKDVHKAAAAIREEEARKQRDYQKGQVNVRGRWSRRMWPVTTIMIAASLVVAGGTLLGNTHNALMDAILFNGDPVVPQEQGEGQDGQMVQVSEEWAASTGFELIARGQVWRLFTPMFVHFTILHLVFNMYWLYYLGGQIEKAKGARFFVILVLVTAATSAIGQCLASHPYFGGMSGVNYGLFGFIWMKMRYQPRDGLWLAPFTVFIMLAWLVFCMTGAMGHVANTAHVVGLAVGILAGMAPTLWGNIRKA